MSTTIEQLELEVQSSSTSAVSGINTLSASLSKLKNAIKGGVGLASVVNQVRNLDTALKSMDSSGADKIDRLASSLEKLKGLDNLKISSSIGNQLRNIGTATGSLTGADFSGLEKLNTALAPLSNFNNTGLRSIVNTLNKLPKLTQTLNGMDWATFTSQIQQLSNALAPLANQLNTVATAFNRLPSNIQRVVTATNRITQENNRAANSYMNLYAKAKMALSVVRNGARTIASWITQSNQYIEDLNLFNASMGQYAAEAQKYAEQVSEVLGIDPGEFMRNQGTFNTIISGFGVASDKAYLMSKNLTQLGYDISSFHNISFEDAMLKLQSGISGELEPLRRLGYDLSVARLQEEALALGIKKKVSAMTQAEKSQLRYYAIMTQVTTAQGDMARTLNAPANQLRVLQAQVTQCARALGNIFIPVLNAVLPYAIAFVKVIRMIADGIASLMGFTLSEVDYSGLENVAGSSSDVADALKDATEKAKKFKKTIMSFDELNILNDNSDSDSLSDSLTGGDLGFTLPEYDFLGDLIDNRVDKIVNIIKDALWEITAVISEFLLAIGTILVVTGANIPLGLGLMAVGAVGLAAAIAANWNGMSERLAKVLTAVTAILGGFLLAIGAILTFSGANIPLGIALMVAGAVSLATAMAINWHALDGNISNVLVAIELTLSGALLGLGAILAFTGANVPLGVALMAAGAVGIATGVGLMWDNMPNQIEQVLVNIELIMGSALLAVGAVLAFSFANVPLGIALMAVGAVSLASAMALNWEGLINSLQTVMNTITMIISGALLGLGAILAFSGVDIPLGVALMVAGAIGLVASMALNWELVSGKIKTVCTIIETIVSGAALALGAIMVFSGGNIPLGIALMALGAVGLVTAVAINWNTIVSKVTEVLKRIGIIAGAALLALGIILCAASVLPLGIALIAAGAVSLVTGVALNWNAVVKHISNFFSTVARLFVGVALVALGVMLLGTGVGIPLGVGLIAAGASAITKPKSFNVQNLIQIGTQAIEGLKTGVQNAWKGFISFWQNLFKNAVDWVKNFLGIHPPSTVFQNIGLNLVAGLQNGLRNIGSVFTSVFSTLSTWLGGFGRNMFTWGSEMMGNLVNGINSGLNNLKSMVSNAANTIRSYLHFSQPDVGPLADFNTWMPDMMSQLASGIADDEGKVRKQVEKLASSMNLEPTLQANVSAYGAVAPTATSSDDTSSGFASAVYKAVSSAIAEQNGGEDSGTPIIINLGNEQIASFLVKQNKRVALISGGKA